MHDEVENLKIERAKFIDNISESSNRYRVCPRCGCDNHIIKFGKFNGVQRYKCKNCNKTFSDVTNTPFYRSKKPLAYWLVYAKFMFQGMTIRDCATMLKINMATAFFWRHKILDSLFFLEGKEDLEGDIQIRDVYFLESHKGQKGKGMEKRPNRFVRRINLDKSVSVLCLSDKNNKIIADPIGKGVFDLYGVRNWMEKRIELAPKANFISSVMKFNNNKLAVNIFNNKIRKGSPEETMRGRALGSKLERWIGKKFKGVATKYLNNYLVWFKYYMSDSFKTYKEFLSKKLNILMSLKNTSFCVNRVMDYKNKSITLYGSR